MQLNFEPPPASNRQRRNEAMASRYYYYHSLCGYRYERCLQELWREFYLAQDTIIDILLAAQPILSELTRREVSVRELSSKYPHLNWRRAGE